ncbi:MAG: hypothetical protein AAGF28_12175 [Pseudomonadota bacterium]
MDTDTGLIEKVRRNLVVGDALGPTIAGIIILFGAVLLFLGDGADKALSISNLRWLFGLFILFAIALVIMRYLGPLTFALSEEGYRPFRATPPWNYVGFLTGGTIMVGGLTGLARRQFSMQDFAIGFVASVFIALAYDLPFDDLVLPPNGDV